MGGSWAVGVGPLGASIDLAAYGGGDSTADPVPPAPAAPAPGPTILENPATASISIQARQVQGVVGKSPADANAWVYDADATAPASGVSRQCARALLQRTPAQ